VISILTGKLVNRSIPHISLHHVTRFEPITAAHFGQRYNNTNKYIVQWILHADDSGTPGEVRCINVDQSNWSPTNGSIDEDTPLLLPSKFIFGYEWSTWHYSRTAWISKDLNWLILEQSIGNWHVWIFAVWLASIGYNRMLESTVLTNCNEGLAVMWLFREKHSSHMTVLCWRHGIFDTLDADDT